MALAIWELFRQEVCMNAISVDSAKLHEWQSPSRMQLFLEAMASQLQGQVLTRQGRDYREAFVACRFAKMRGAIKVRLLAPNGLSPTPDFAVIIDENELWYETTETDRPGRKRGDEDHTPTDKVVMIPDDDWTDPQEYFTLVQQRVQRKAAKTYAKCDGLIIWSNAFPVKTDFKLTPDWWRGAAQSAIGEFTEVWVHQKSEFLLLT